MPTRSLKTSGGDLAGASELAVRFFRRSRAGVTIEVSVRRRVRTTRSYAISRCRASRIEQGFNWSSEHACWCRRAEWVAGLDPGWVVHACLKINSGASNTFRASPLPVNR